MSVYRPNRKSDASKFYVCEFLIHGKRIQESTGTTSKTVAKEYEKRRRTELERAAAGMPTEQKANRIRSVQEIVTPYLDGYELNHRAKSVLFSKGRLDHVRGFSGRLLSDLNEDRVRDYIRQRQEKKVSGRTINMELGELSRAIGQPWSLLWPRCGNWKSARTWAGFVVGGAAPPPRRPEGSPHASPGDVGSAACF